MEKSDEDLDKEKEKDKEKDKEKEKDKDKDKDYKDDQPNVNVSTEKIIVNSNYNKNFTLNLTNKSNNKRIKFGQNHSQVILQTKKHCHSKSNLLLLNSSSLSSSLSSTISSSSAKSSSSSSTTSTTSTLSLGFSSSNCSSLQKQKPIPVKDLSDLISCRLCHGYLIDATTIVECLHSFCKTCIINHLDNNTPKSRFCPVCDTQIHKTKPKLNIRSDPTLQDIVYKLVPGLFKNEMDRRKEFYSREPESAVGLSSEERGEMSGERLIFTPDDTINLSIEYFPQVISYSLLPFSKNLNNGALNCESSFDKTNNSNQRRYLRCQGGMRVMHLKKWLKLKYDIKDDHHVEIMYKHDPLCDDYTMMDLAYIYSWRRNGPLCLYYKIIDSKTKQKEEEEESDLKKKFVIVPKRKQSKNKDLNFKTSQTTTSITTPPATKKTKSSLDYESNLITTNPVNEPLSPVTTFILNIF